MIRVFAKSIVKEKEVENYLGYVTDLVNETRKEEGCILYELYQDVNNDKVYTLVEEWESLKSLDDHKKTNHMIRLLPLISSCRESVEVVISKKVL